MTTINNIASEVKIVASKPTEQLVSDYINNRSYEEISLDVANDAWDNKPLSENVVYHANNIGGLPIYWIRDNRRSFKRGLKMYDACLTNGMTTPAVVVDAKVVVDWELPLIDPCTGEEVVAEKVKDGYAIMEGHGRHHAYLISLAVGNVFDFHFVYKKYDSPEAFGNAYTSTNADMTRTTNTDRLQIAAVRCQNPLVQEHLRKIRVDHCIPKASYFWTYGREIISKEITALTMGEENAPQFPGEMVEALQKVYEAFKTCFNYCGAEQIYRGVSAAQWSSERLKSSRTPSAEAEAICKKLEGISKETYTALVSAKGNKKMNLNRDAVIKTVLDNMMQ